MKLATIEKQATETVDVHLAGVHLHFADDSTPTESGGPGALIVELPGVMMLRLPATDPLTVALRSKIIAALSAGQLEPGVTVKPEAPAPAPAGKP